MRYFQGGNARLTLGGSLNRMFIITLLSRLY